MASDHGQFSAIRIDYARPVMRLKIDLVNILRQQGSSSDEGYLRACSLIDGFIVDSDEPNADQETIYRAYEDVDWLLLAQASEKKISLESN